MSRDKILHDSWSISRGVKWCVPGSSLGRHLESGVDPGNEVAMAHTTKSSYWSLELRKGVVVLDISSCGFFSAANSYLLFPGRNFYVEHNHQSCHQ